MLRLWAVLLLPGVHCGEQDWLENPSDSSGAGERVRFRRMPLAEANAREREQDSEVEVLLDLPDTRRQAFDPTCEDAVQDRLPVEAGTHGSLLSTVGRQGFARRVRFADL